MGWVMDGLESDRYDRSYGDVVLVRRIARYFKPHWRGMLVVALMVVLNSGVDAGIPILISEGIDLVTGTSDSTSLWLVVGGVLIFSSLAWVFNYFRRSVSARVVGDVVLRLREDAFASVTKRDLSFYDEQPSGKIVSRVTSDTQDFSDVVMLVMNLVSEVILVVILFFVLFSVSAHLTLILIALIPVVMAVALSFRRLARTVTQKARRVLAKVNALIQESISGIAIAKNFRQEAAVYRDFQNLNTQTYGVNLIRGWVLNTIIPILDLGAGLGTALLIYYGGIASLSGLVSAGEWFLFVQTMYYFWFPLTSIASFWSQFQDGLSAAERVFSLIDAEPKVVQYANDPVGKLRGSVQFRDVRLTYTGQEVVLDGFSLAVKPGERVALVGHTGAGKSSLARLIGRFYEFQDGQILIDGREIRSLDLSQYRRRLGIVPQEPFLFSGTVADNIRYTRPDATDDEVAEAARMIADGEWVDDLANGLKTDVGEARVFPWGSGSWLPWRGWCSRTQAF